MSSASLENKKTEKTMMINMGPSHPAMHGIIKVVLELSGETVVNADVEIGYLHRAFEKSSEQAGYLQVVPYTDRLNYVSPLINNFAYVEAVEKLFGIQVTQRCQYIRVIMSEISRITDHLTCVGASAMELGAFSAFLYMIKAREYLYELVEQVTGARLTVSYARVGGVKADLPHDFKSVTLKAFKETRQVLNEVDRLLSRNRIFVDRMKDIGVISAEKALSYSITGPFLRSTGVDYDVRKDQPYSAYADFDFDIPVGEKGDNMDRYLIRMEEMQQSMRIVEQALEKIPGGGVNVDMDSKEIPEEYLSGEFVSASQLVDDAKMGRTRGIQKFKVEADDTLEGSTGEDFAEIYSTDKRVGFPQKEQTYGNIEGLINHFKSVMYGHGIQPPKGEAYHAVEGANGELGFYVVSDGTGTPYRVRCRPPCFYIMSALHELIKGDTLADIVPTFGSVNMIGGELDR